MGTTHVQLGQILDSCGKFVLVNENEHRLSEDVYQGRMERWLLHGL